MKLLLSYAPVAIASYDKVHISGRVGPSVRRLISVLVKSKGSPEESDSASVQFPGRLGDGPSSFVKVTELKRGDYICPRCSFMNFARNKKCLQCEEPRPKKFLTGGEWECPQCDFFNCGRNEVCLRCDCKNLEINSLQGTANLSDLGAQVSSSPIDSEKADTEGQQQQWFSKVAELVTSSDLSTSLSEEDLLRSIKARDNKFSAHSGNLDMGGNPVGVDNNLSTGGESKPNVGISQSVDELLAKESRVLSRDASPFPSSSSTPLRNEHLNNGRSSQVTFNSVNEQSHKAKATSHAAHNVVSERSFEEVAEPRYAEDLPNATSDVDFPDIMPMRKGENLFVVSKKKDRSLSSPMYKRRMAMEKAGNNNYVPFVPFPPGFFNQGKPQEGPDSSNATLESEVARDDRSAIPSNSETAPISSQQTVSNSGDHTRKAFTSQLSSSPDGYSHREGKTSNDYYGASSQSVGNPSAMDSWRGRSLEGSAVKEPGSLDTSEGKTAEDSYGASSQFMETPSVTDSWRGVSLEGSAVKEPDPLDMSEEAKAERWFRRVAQIKDISELSQIPDEDFPSIMPMRKGVNRFVVSKRKTPLERRLTSSRYRKNPPMDGETDNAREQK